jgi:hypothetical protein
LREKGTEKQRETGKKSSDILYLAGDLQLAVDLGWK